MGTQFTCSVTVQTTTLPTMKCSVAIVLLVLAASALAAEHKSAEGRDKRGALLAYDYAYPYYAAPYAYSPYYSAAYVASPYARSAYVASPYTAPYTAAYYYK